MAHQVPRTGLEVSAHPGQYGVRSLAHQGDQLNPVAAVDRDPAMVGIGVAGAVPVEVVPPGPQASRVYSPMVTSV